jgi:hypothetical protein
MNPSHLCAIDIHSMKAVTIGHPRFLNPQSSRDLFSSHEVAVSARPCTLLVWSRRSVTECDDQPRKFDPMPKTRTGVRLHMLSIERG